MSLTYEDRIESDPWGLVSDALACAAKKEPCPEDLQDAVSIVAASLTAAALIRGGAKEADVERQFMDRDWSVQLGWKEGELSIGIEWEDGTRTDVAPSEPSFVIDSPTRQDAENANAEFDFSDRNGLFIPAFGQVHASHCLVEKSSVGGRFLQFTLADGRVVHVEMHSSEPLGALIDGTALFEPRFPSVALSDSGQVTPP